MAWTPAGTIQLTRDWQYTEPIATGSYFRLKHAEARNGDLFAVAQCEVDSEGNLSIGDTQVLAVEKGIADVIELPKNAFTDRRIAIKRILSQPSLEQEFRRLFLPNFLIPPDQEIRFIRRNNWMVAIEVSDYVDAEYDYSSNFADITSRLTTIEQKIDNINTSSGGTTTDSTSDPHFNNVTFLAHFDTDFSDVKGHTITPFGNPVISTDQSKFGGASVYFDGASSLSSPSTDWYLANNDFTIEAWLYPINIDTYGSTIISQWNSGSQNDNSWIFYLDSATKNIIFELTETGQSNSANLCNSNQAIALNTWSHVAAVRQSGIIKIYLNGIQYGGDFSRPQSFYDSRTPLTIGGITAGVASGIEWIGYQDEIRITKGIARYTSNFTPSAAAFPNT